MLDVDHCIVVGIACGVIPSVISQVVGWENPNPTIKMATTKRHYT